MMHKISATSVVYAVLLITIVMGAALEKQAGYDLYATVFAISAAWFAVATSVSWHTDLAEVPKRNWRFYVGDVSVIVVLVLLGGIEGYETELWDEIPWIMAPVLIYFRHQYNGFFSSSQPSQTDKPSVAR